MDWKEKWPERATKTGQIKRVGLTCAEKTEVFEHRARSIHGGKYDYSLVEYINNRTKVWITCFEHGDFEQAPKGHIAGKGCTKCKFDNLPQNQKATKEGFLAKLEGDTRGYTYDNVIYMGSDIKVAITCPEHGDFMQTPNNHLSKGQHCPKCRCNSQNTVYLLDMGYGIYKIGITSETGLKTRVQTITRSYGSPVELIAAAICSDPRKHETHLHNAYSSAPFNAGEFDGSTECRELNLKEVEEIKEYINGVQ